MYLSDTTQDYRTDFPGLPNSQQYNNPFQQQALPGYLPAYTTPHTPAAGGVPLSAASGHQHVLASTESVSTEPASTESAQKPKHKSTKKPQRKSTTRKSTNRKSTNRKKGDAEHEEEHEEKDKEDKDAEKKNKGDKGVRTKERKQQDIRDRQTLSRLRDEAASRAFEMASQYVPAGAARIALQQQFDLIAELSGEADRNTEAYITWNSTRADLRLTDRAVPERKKED